MKTLFIAVSLTANLLLAAFALRPALAPPVFRDFFDGGSRPSVARSSGTTSRTDRAPKAASQSAGLWSRLQTDDLPTLAARLRAMGFPTAIVRAVISAEVSARYTSQLNALINDPRIPFWKQTPGIRLDSPNYEEYARLQRERSKLLRDLFSDPAFATDDVTAAQHRKFGDLSRQKIDLVQRIEDDYSDMTSALHIGFGSVMLPEDRAKLALLTNEKHADLAALLTPEELADYEVRSSPMVALLGRNLGALDPSEAEFRAIVRAQQRYGAVVSPNGNLDAGNDPALRQQALQQLVADLQTGLGEARYADYQRETNREFQQLSAITQRENLPAALATQAFNLRDTVAAESTRIFEDPSLSPEQKRAALQTLAQNTRAQTLALLGPAAGAAYAKIQDTWLNRVEGGSALMLRNDTVTMSMGTIGDNGVGASFTLTGGPSYRQVPPPRPPSAR